MHRPRHATVVAYLALFVALGGTAYAADLLPARSVGERELKSRAVTALKLGVLPNARLESTTATLPDSVPSGIAFEGAAFRGGGVKVTDKRVLVAPQTGVYAITAGLRFPANAKGIRAMFIARDDGSYLANHEDSADADPDRSTIYTVSTLARLRKGQGVQVLGFQNTGAPMPLPADPRSFLTIHFVSR